jgi:bifunctional non-homologous end joining protein LigD
MKSFVFPEYMLPQLSCPSPTPPEGDHWISEIKLDGYRLMCCKNGEKVDFYTRHGHRWTDKFPAIAKQVRQLGVRHAWLDGELVVIGADGRSSFGELQRAVSKCDQAAMAFHAFDLPWADGDLCWETLENRKNKLSELLGQDAVWNLQYVDYQKGFAPEFFEAACLHNLEGIVSKRADSPYRQGLRTRTWLKSKFKGYQQDCAWKWWRAT